MKAPWLDADAVFAPIGAAFSVVLGKMLDAGRAPSPGAVELPYIRAANIQDSGLDLANVNRMPFTPLEVARLDLRRGDLLVVEGGAIGTCVVLDEDMFGWAFQKTVNRVRSSGNWSTRYLAYVLRAYRDAGIIDLICNGSTIAHLTAEKLRSLRIPAFSPSKQVAIADFLDRETDRIDTLIAKQVQLIDTLHERHDAAIDKLVWQGLDPSAAFTPTEIDTVPLAPAQWLRRRNKDILVERTDISSSGTEELLTVSHLTGITPRSEKSVTMFEAASLEGYRAVRLGF